MSVSATSRIVLVLGALAASAFVHGQSPEPQSLPDAPQAAQNMVNGADPGRAGEMNANGEAAITSSSFSTTERSRPFLHRVVPAGDGPQDLTSTQKFELSFRSRIGVGAVGSSIFGAGERQLFNSRPHYGTDSGAFGERLGAAELKQVTESFFSYGLYPAVFHQDPHYYVMGRGQGHSLQRRAVYSATRLVLTRTDTGDTRINWSKLAGMASATVLTNAYYPPADRGVRETISAYGSSLASSVLTLELHEFMPDVMHALLHRHQVAQ